MTILAFIALGLCFFYQIPAYFARFLPPKRRVARTSRVALASMSHFVTAAKAYIGLRLDYGRVPSALPDRFIVVSNHQSLLDIPILMHFFRKDRRLLFVSKKELGWGIPLISDVLRLGGHALIDRKGGVAASMRSIAAMARRAAVFGFCPVIFPEGTRSKDGGLGKFHAAGLRRMLDVTPLPLVVVAIDGGYAINKLDQLLASGALATYRVKALAVLEPVPGKQGVTEALEKAEALIAAELDAWRS